MPTIGNLQFLCVRPCAADVSVTTNARERCGTEAALCGLF